jgi:hypothetical protein
VSFTPGEERIIKAGNPISLGARADLLIWPSGIVSIIIFTVFYYLYTQTHYRRVETARISMG